jgi:hypothetical protein
MDWLTFITKITEALAWPLVALILGLVVRKRVLDLIPALRKFKAGPVEAEFGIATKQILVEASEVSGQSISPAGASSPETGRTEDKHVVAKLLQARSNPSGVILDGWGSVDGELFRLGHQMGLLNDSLTNTGKVYESVMRSDILPVGTKKLVMELRDLRNQVAHAKVEPTADAAQDYVLAVDRVVELIHNYRKNLPNYGSTNRKP